MKVFFVFCDRKLARLYCLKTCRSVRCMRDERSLLRLRSLLRWKRLTVQVSNSLSLLLARN